MRPRQFGRPRRGVDFVLSDVPMLDSPVWSDDETHAFFGRMSPAIRQPAYQPHNYRNAPTEAMGMHPGHGRHMGSPNVVMPSAPNGPQFRPNNVATRVAVVIHAGRGEATRGGYAQQRRPPPQFGGRPRQNGSGAHRTGHTAHNRGHSNFQCDTERGDEYADDEYDGIAAALDRVEEEAEEEEEDTRVNDDNTALVSHYGGFFGADRRQSRFEFQRGSLFAPSAHPFIDGMDECGDTTDSGSDGGDDDVSRSPSTSGSDHSEADPRGLPSTRRTSRAPHAHGCTVDGAEFGVDEATPPPLPRRRSARGTSVASAFLIDRPYQHPSVFMAKAAGRPRASSVGTTLATPSMFRSFFVVDDEDSFDDTDAGDSPSASRSKTYGSAAPSMMVSSAPQNRAAAATGRPVHGSITPATAAAAAAAARLPELSTPGHYSYMPGSTASTNIVVSNTPRVTITDSNSAEATDPTSGADLKLGGLLSNRAQGSFLVAMDDVPASVRAQHAATTRLLPPDASARERQDGRPRPAQLSSGLQTEGCTGVRGGGLGAALAEYAKLTNRMASESRRAPATSTPSAHSDHPAEERPSQHQLSDDALDSDEDSAVQERRSRFFELSTARRSIVRDEDGGQQQKGVYPNVLFLLGASERGEGQHKAQPSAAPPSGKGQPDRINFRNRITSRGQCVGGGGCAQGLPPRRPAPTATTDPAISSAELLDTRSGSATTTSSTASTPNDATVARAAEEADEYGLLTWPAGTPIHTRFSSTVSSRGFSDLAGCTTPVAPPSAQLMSKAAPVAGRGRSTRRTSSNASTHIVVTILDEADGTLAAPASTRRSAPSVTDVARPRGVSQRTPPPPQLTTSTLQSAQAGPPSSTSNGASATGTTPAATLSAVPTVTIGSSMMTSLSAVTPSPCRRHSPSLYHQDEYFLMNDFRNNSVDGLASGAAAPYRVTTKSTAVAARRSRDDELDPLAQPRQSLHPPSLNRLRVAEDDQRRLSRANRTPDTPPVPHPAPMSFPGPARAHVVFVSTAGAAGPHDVPFASTPRAEEGIPTFALDGEYQLLSGDVEMSSSGGGGGYTILANSNAIVPMDNVAPGRPSARANASAHSAAFPAAEHRVSAQTTASGDHVASIVSSEEVQLPQTTRKRSTTREKRHSSRRKRSLRGRAKALPKTQEAARRRDSSAGPASTTSGAELSAPQPATRDARPAERVVMTAFAAQERGPHVSPRSPWRLKALVKRMTM